MDSSYPSEKETLTVTETLLRPEELMAMAQKSYAHVDAGPEFGVYASSGPNFSYAVFGRDSIVFARDVLDIHPEKARDIIRVLARFQGKNFERTSEEEPGKIVHEHRQSYYGDKTVSYDALRRMKSLQEKWGSTRSRELNYYGSYDATPLYITLVGEYVAHHGRGILDEQFVDHDGQTHTIAETIRQAAIWLTTKLQASVDSGRPCLLEYRRINPEGLLNQVWKDSDTAYLHVDGTPAASENGLASAELQAYAYDALLAAAHLLEDESENEKYLRGAKQVQQATLQYLWMPHHQYFAQGLDYDRQGKPRQIQSITSNGALLLNSRLLLDLPVEVRTTYVDGIVRHITGPNFMTPVGIRCRSISHLGTSSIVDYHGMFAVWAKETNEIAVGLRKHGRDDEAKILEAAIIKGIESTREFRELYYVGENGKVYYDRFNAKNDLSTRYSRIDMPKPEPDQAWTISAVMRIIAKQMLVDY